MTTPSPTNPASKRDERKRIVAAIVQENGGRLEKKTALYKAFYLAHLFYWNESEGLLTKAPDIVRMPNGPGIPGSAKLFREMVAEGLIRMSEQPCGPFKESVFETARPVQVSEAERSAIQKALAVVTPHTASKVSDISHTVSRTWRGSKDGDHLDIYLDVLSDEEYAARQREIDEAAVQVKSIFG